VATKILFSLSRSSRVPQGCTEQRFYTWIPYVAGIDYLKKTDRLTESFLQQAEYSVKDGYQTLLNKRNSDGSFSFFYSSGKSVWLTAYVAKILTYAKTLMAVDDQKIDDALKFVKGHQKPDGSFHDDSTIYDHYSSVSNKGIPLTAFIAIAFMESSYADVYKDVIDNALIQINHNAINLTDNYALAISAYAFSFRRVNESNSFLNELMKNAIEEPNKMHWNREKTNINSNDGNSIKIQIASYAIMALVKLKQAERARPIVKWLLEYRNSHGGYPSTTDTVAAFQALAMVGPLYYSPKTLMDVELSYERGQKEIFNIRVNNIYKPDYRILKQNARQMSLKVNGTGFAMLQVAYMYNVIENLPNHRFILRADVLKTSTESQMHLKVCAKFTPIVTRGGQGVNSTGMALMEINLPSGFVNDPSTAENVKKFGVRVSI